MTRACATCGAAIAPDAPRHHVLCRACFIQVYQGKPRTRTASKAPMPKRQAVVALGLDRAMFRSLVSLCHPDKHAQSDCANRVTAWLNTTVRHALDDPPN